MLSYVGLFPLVSFVLPLLVLAGLACPQASIVPCCVLLCIFFSLLSSLPGGRTRVIQNKCTAPIRHGLDRTLGVLLVALSASLCTHQTPPRFAGVLLRTYWMGASMVDTIHMRPLIPCDRASFLLFLFQAPLLASLFFASAFFLYFPPSS